MKKSTSSPLAIFALYSPKGTYDPLFISNYAYVNINDPMTRVQGIGQVQISGAGQYAMRFWVRPDTLAKLEITVNDIVNAIQAQNTVNAAGQIGGNPVPPGQQFTYTVRAPGRLDVARGVREHRGPRAPGWLGRPGEGRGARRARGAELQRRRAGSTAAPPRSSPSISSPARTRIATVARAKAADGGDEGAIPGRSRLHRLARHDARGHGGHRRDRQDAVRGARRS